MSISNQVQLITYVDRLCGDISGLDKFLTGPVQGAFAAVHLLPFFYPIDGSDAGFDPVEHSRVDPVLGDWSDVQLLSRHTDVICDLIVNHVSRESEQFLDVVANGRNSQWWDFFLRANDIFEDGVDDPAVEKIYRPREGAPFAEVELADGESVAFWSTFTDNQLDINVESEAGKRYLTEILQLFADADIKVVRLDAAGYAIKRAGTSCFLLPETYTFISELTAQANDLGIEVLAEFHGHHEQQIALAAQAMVYDFALPPLLLHAFYQADASPLKNWLTISPTNCVTVLDTHDGIGIVDVRGADGRPGLLTNSQADELIDEIHRKTGFQSCGASGNSADNLDVYQVNTTFFDALGGDSKHMLIARAIQFFVPGVPQVYYVGLLGGRNDMQLLEVTGVGRDINRHYYTGEEVDSSLETPFVRGLLELIELRNTNEAFGGEFALMDTATGELGLRWHTADAAISLSVDFQSLEAHIDAHRGSTVVRYAISSSGLKETAL